MVTKSAESLLCLQVDSVAASLAAVGGWLRDGVKLLVLGALGLGLLPLLIGGFMELAMVPLRCGCRRRNSCCRVRSHSA
jgi:hypothetical protein